MTNSINTNVSAYAALQTLNRTNSLLSETQNRISTGLKVSSALDDASNFTIAQGLRGEIKAYSAVVQGLNNAKGVGKVALAGATGVSDLLTNIRSKITELSNDGITADQRSILTADLNDLVSQAQNFVTNAKFNGVNMLETASTDISILSNLDGGTLTLSAQDLETTLTDLAAADVSTAANAQTVLTTEFTAIQDAVNTAMSKFGSQVRALDLQTNFLTKISDAVEVGLGNIVDADLARESARLTALQVAQQLGIQSLGIANQSPQVLLGLFR
jgi:flagellin